MSASVVSSQASPLPLPRGLDSYCIMSNTMNDFDASREFTMTIHIQIAKILCATCSPNRLAPHGRRPSMNCKPARGSNWGTHSGVRKCDLSLELNASQLLKSNRIRWPSNLNSIFHHLNVPPCKQWVIVWRYWMSQWNKEWMSKSQPMFRVVLTVMFVC